MHILLGILTVVGVIAFIIYRMRDAAQAGQHLAEAAGDLKRLVRRNQWKGKNKSKSDMIREVDDPRMAATIMMAAIAMSDGEMTERQRATILDLMREHFEAEDADAEELLAQGRWLASADFDLSTMFGRLTNVIRTGCDDAEKRELLAMLETVGSVEGSLSDAQSAAIGALTRSVGIAH